MENKNGMPPGPPAAALSPHRTPNSQFRLPGRLPGSLSLSGNPRDPASTRPQPDGTPSVPASTHDTFFEIRVACPSLPLQGGAPAWGTHLDRGPPRCISVCPASFLSPTLRQSHQGIGAGNRGCISRCRLFWSRVSQMAPRPPPPFFLQSLPSPPSRPQILTTSHTTPGAPHPLHNPSMHPCTGCDRGTDSVAICQSHQALLAPSVDDPPPHGLVSSSTSQHG
jgi:hypothetical protein